MYLLNLFFFTNSFPFGNAYKWPEGEVLEFVKSFEHVEIYPFSYEGKRNIVKLPADINVREPLLENDLIGYSFLSLFKTLNSRFFFYWKEFFRQKVFLKRYWIKTWLFAIEKTEILLHSATFKNLIESERASNTVLYFFWGNNQSLMIPFLRNKKFRKIAIRFHGFDLYKERLGGYQPFRQRLLDSVDIILPISNFGSEYLKNHYRISCELKVQRLGTRSFGRSLPSRDGVFRCVVCARLIRLKRVDLVIESLKYLDKKVILTIIGDGEEMTNLKTLAGQINTRSEVIFLGWVESGKISDYYINENVDLFILTSETEGIPVSIMEALAAGIPILSTNVGGISEIIDESVGKLLPSEIDSVSLAKEIDAFVSMPIEMRLTLRENAFLRFKNKCDSNDLNKELVRLLLN